MDWSNTIGFVIVILALMGYGFVDGATTPDNPFEEDPIVVNVTYEDGLYYTYNEQINETITYWNENDDRYGNWTGEMVFRPDAKDPDITVSVQHEIDSCGMNVAILSEFSGCSQIITDDMEYGYTTVKILGERPQDDVLRTLKHEFGHIHGLDHGDDPQPLMDGEAG